MSTILFVTWRDLPDLAEDDRAVVAILRARGHDVRATVWDDDVNWAAADAVILRSVWDYHLRPAEFAGWLDVLERTRARLWNPVGTVRWNAHKGYLLELAARGLPVVPTVLLRAGADRDLGALLDDRVWDHAVVKPAVAASAWGARAVRRGAAAHDLADWREHDLLVQPLVTEVATAGEWSLMYVGGAFSHAALKRPGAGDFRVQHELGGSIEAAEPPAEALAVAQRILDGLTEPWLYARIDGVMTEPGFLLMEVELLEPSLFLDLDAAAPARFADAIESRLTG